MSLELKERRLGEELGVSVEEHLFVDLLVEPRALVDEIEAALLGPQQVVLRGDMSEHSLTHRRVVAIVHCLYSKENFLFNILLAQSCGSQLSAH